MTFVTVYDRMHMTLTDQGVHHNQSFDQKLGNLRMVFIDQLVGEIIVNVCVLCESEKDWIYRLQTYKELNYYNDYILNRGCPHKPRAK